MIMNESRSFLPCRQLIYISEKKVFDFFRSFLGFFWEASLRVKYVDWHWCMALACAGKEAWMEGERPVGERIKFLITLVIL